MPYHRQMTASSPSAKIWVYSAKFCCPAPAALHRRDEAAGLLPADLPNSFDKETRSRIKMSQLTHTPDIERPSKEIIEALKSIGSATATGELSRLGIKNPFIQGPVPYTPGKVVVGPALTLQFMPKREDVYNVTEYTSPEVQLHRHVLYHTQPGDVVVVDARGELTAGVFGDMMLTYFTGKGGAGVVIDGCIRDYPKAKDLGIGLWLKGVTPNFHTQTTIFPYAVNVPVACGGTLVMPGDIIIADDDGV